MLFDGRNITKFKDKISSALKPLKNKTETKTIPDNKTISEDKEKVEALQKELKQILTEIRNEKDACDGLNERINKNYSRMYEIIGSRQSVTQKTKKSNVETEEVKLPDDIEGLELAIKEAKEILLDLKVTRKCLGLVYGQSMEDAYKAEQEAYAKKIGIYKEE